MSPILQALITVICSLIASSGFWAVLTKRMDKKDVTKEMLLGLAHDRIMFLCTMYLERGDWITYDEFDNLDNYLFKPYTKMGGNGTAKILMDRVDDLKLVKNPPNRENV